MNDSESEVRFWACFTVGAIRVSDVSLKLRVLAQTDDAVVAGWWSVGKEALSFNYSYQWQLGF